MAARTQRHGSRARSAQVEPLMGPLDVPKPETALIFADNKTSIDSRKHTDSFAISSSRNNTDSYARYYKPSVTTFDDSEAYRSTLNINTISKMCIYYLVLFLSFALIVLFIIRISEKLNKNDTLNHKSIDIALCIVSSTYFISVIIISFVFVHQYLYKIIDKEDVSYSIKHDPHPGIRYMPRSTSSKLKYFTMQMFFKFNRFQISVWMCFIHQLISSALYIIQYENDHWNIAFFLNKLLAAFGFILPSICVHIYCNERNYICNHFWKNSQLSSRNYTHSLNSSQTQLQKTKLTNRSDIDRETKAIAASSSIFASKMLMGCLCLGYIVQIVLFMAEPFWGTSFYKDIEGEYRYVYMQIFNMNQLIFRSFVGIFLSETIVVLLFVIMDTNCVNQSFKILLFPSKRSIIRPRDMIILILFVLMELSLTVMLKNNMNDITGYNITDIQRKAAEIVLNSFWMLVHLIIIIIVLKYAIIGKLIYEEKLKRKISVFYGYVASNIPWFVTECMLLLVICLCYLTQLSLNNALHHYDRFDVYRHWIIYAMLAIEMMLLIQYKQINKCTSFKKYFSADHVRYFIRCLKILIFINLFDFCYVVIFQFDYFYRQYYWKQKDSELPHRFETFAFVFCFGMPAFILLNLSHCVECYIHWKLMPMPGIEMSASESLPNH